MRRLHLLLVCTLLAACAGVQRSATADAPSAEEYAVWSAALDARFGSTIPRYRVMEETYSWVTSMPGDSEWLRTRSGLPDTLLEDYIARNARRARVQVRRLHPRSVRLHPSPPAAAVEGLKPPWITLSRVGFDRGGTRAMVSVVSDCGSLCKGGALMVMEREGSGPWKVTSAPVGIEF